MPSVVQHLCDPCYAAGESEAGAPVAVKIGAVERVLIVCEAHDHNLLAPLRGLLDEYGQPPTPAKPAKAAKRRKGDEPEVAVTPVEEEFACRAKGCKRTFPKAQGRAMHEYRTHGMRATDAA